MANGRISHPIVKERISFNLAKLKKGGETFEIVLKDPNLALEFQRGKPIEMRDILESEKVFKDANKGEVQSETKMKQWLGTSDAIEAAKVILKQGEVALTAEHRKAMFEAKKKRILEYIHMNAADPKTGLPHPLQRLELAMEQAKVQIDPYTPAEAQVDKIISELRPILPLKFEKVRIRITIPAKYAGSAYATLKKKYELKGEQWLNDGSVQFEMQTPAGLKLDIFNIINKLTSGEAQIEELK